jgi:hypothetical protein
MECPLWRLLIFSQSVSKHGHHMQFLFLIGRFLKNLLLKLLSYMNRILVGSIYMYGRFCIKFPQSRMKGKRHRLSPLSLYFFLIFRKKGRIWTPRTLPPLGIHYCMDINYLKSSSYYWLVIYHLILPILIECIKTFTILLFITFSYATPYLFPIFFCSIFTFVCLIFFISHLN